MNKSNENEIKNKVHAKNNAIENAIGKLDKANIILQHWTQEYSYSEKPDPKAAIDWFHGDKSLKARQSAAWFHDYNYIFDFIDIVFDYVIESKKVLEKDLKDK